MKMIRKLNMRKSASLGVALILAAGMTYSSAASAIAGRPRDPVCDQAVANACTTNYGTWGYPTYNDCVRLEQCYQCPPSYGYLCGYDPRF
jgi:hypothetical protein